MLDAQAVRFARPPVRTVRLAYYFEMPSPVLGLHGGALRELWRAAYPLASEIAPRAPIGGEPDEFAVVEDEDRWPVPFFTFESPDTQRTVFFQSDRFGVSWEFDSSAEEDRQYPGFERLADEMNSRYEEFLTVVQRDTDETMKPMSAECFYVNDVANVSLNSYVMGYLSGWDDGSYDRPLADDEASRYVRHFHADGDRHQLGWVRAVSADAGISLSLTVRVESEVFSAPREGLSMAHDRLIGSFLDSTSNAMRSTWGPE